MTTFAGGVYGFADGQGTAAMFRVPRDMKVDSLGSVYVADVSRIRKITSSGSTSFTAA